MRFWCTYTDEPMDDLEMGGSPFASSNAEPARARRLRREAGRRGSTPTSWSLRQREQEDS